jgi:hypothetical protein
MRLGRTPNVLRDRRKRFWRRCRRRSRSHVFLPLVPALLHRLLQFLLVIRKESMNLVMSFVANRVNLRPKCLSRSVRTLIKQCLNPIVVIVKDRPDLLLLYLSQLQNCRKASKFLVDRLRRVDILKLLTGRGLPFPIVLSYGRTGHSEHEHDRIRKCERSISHGQQSPKGLSMQCQPRLCLE